MPRAVYFFCYDLERDPVATHVFQVSEDLFNLEDTGVSVDGFPVRAYQDDQGNEFVYVRTHEVISHDYPYYLPLLNEHFAEFDLGGVVNWHEGQNAPEKILCAHTTGDVPSGHFGPADPGLMRNLFLALEENRKASGLLDFSTVTEATHWSGIPYEGDPALVPQYPVPLLDIEIGSFPQDWQHPKAAEVLARSIVQVFRPAPAQARSLLCVGGVHFEPAFRHALLDFEGESPLMVSHILPNQWVVAGAYEQEAGLEKLQACVASIKGGIDGIVFHHKLKGPYKAQLRALAEGLGVPAFKHKDLRRPEVMPF